MRFEVWKKNPKKKTCSHLNTDKYNPRKALLPYKPKFLSLICTCVSTFVLEQILEMCIQVVLREKKSDFLLFFWYCCRQCNQNLTFLVHFVNNQSLCVCCVNIQLLRLWTPHSECHVVTSRVVIFCVLCALLRWTCLHRCQLFKYKRSCCKYLFDFCQKLRL